MLGPVSKPDVHQPRRVARGHPARAIRPCEHGGGAPGLIGIENLGAGPPGRAPWAGLDLPREPWLHDRLGALADRRMVHALYANRRQPGRVFP